MPSDISLANFIYAFIYSGFLVCIIACIAASWEKIADAADVAEDNFATLFFMLCGMPRPEREEEVLELLDQQRAAPDAPLCAAETVQAAAMAQVAK